MSIEDLAAAAAGDSTGASSPRYRLVVGTPRIEATVDNVLAEVLEHAATIAATYGEAAALDLRWMVSEYNGTKGQRRKEER